MASPRSDDNPDGDPQVRRVRRLVALAGGGALLLTAALGALPFVASRPRPAPDVKFVMIDGQQPMLSSLRGQPVLVSFWSTTCAPCMEEMPALIAFHRSEAARGLRTVAVAMAYDRPDRVLDLAQRQQLPFDIALDLGGEVAKAFSRTEVTPTKFLIDAEGRIVRTMVGSTDFAELREALQTLRAG